MRIMEKLKAIFNEGEKTIDRNCGELCEAINEIMKNDEKFIRSCVEEVSLKDQKKKEYPVATFILTLDDLKEKLDWMDSSLFVMSKRDIKRCVEILGFKVESMEYDAVPSFPGLPREQAKRYYMKLVVDESKLRG